MASKTTHPETPPTAESRTEQPLLTVDELREKYKIKRPIFAGVCAANDWKPGRAMTGEAFLRAVAVFTGAPMGAPQGKRG